MNNEDKKCLYLWVLQRTGYYENKKLLNAYISSNVWNMNEGINKTEANTSLRRTSYKMEESATHT